VVVQNVSDWDLWLAIQSERFRDIQPANTLVQAGIIGDLVEMDTEAVLNGFVDVVEKYICDAKDLLHFK